jgi:hypothetical protein
MTTVERRNVAQNVPQTVLRERLTNAGPKIRLTYT